MVPPDAGNRMPTCLPLTSDGGLVPQPLEHYRRYESVSDDATKREACN